MDYFAASFRSVEIHQYIVHHIQTTLGVKFIQIHVKNLVSDCFFFYSQQVRKSSYMKVIKGPFYVIFDICEVNTYKISSMDR